MNPQKLTSASKIPLLWSFLITTASALAVSVFFFKIQPQVPIFYSLPRPAQHLASKQWLFLFPAISFLISFIQVVILRIIKQKDKLLIKLFAWTSVGMQFLLGIALLRILIIVT